MVLSVPYRQNRRAKDLTTQRYNIGESFGRQEGIGECAIKKRSN